MKNVISIIGVLISLLISMSAPAQAPGLLSKKPIGNNYCAISRPSLGPDGNFYLAVGDCDVASPLIRGVASLDRSGALRWGMTYPAGCDQHPHGHEGAGGRGVSVATDGTLLGVGDWNQCRNGRLFALAPNDGSVLWETGGCAGSPHPRQVPVIDDQTNSAIYGTAYLCSVDIATGALNWQSSAAGQYIGGYGIASDSAKNIFVGSIGGALSELSSVNDSGQVRWRDSYAYSDADHQTVVAISGDDNVLVQRLSPTSVLQYRSGATGSVIWQVSNLQYPVIGANDTIYAGEETGSDVVALEVSGNEVWRSSVGTGPGTFVDFVDAEENLYVRSGSDIFLVDGATGALLWTFSADADISVPVALNSAGQPFFADATGQAYVLDTCSEYAASTWPVARFGNERHTGIAGVTTSTIGTCNEPPTADAGVDAAIRAGDSVLLDGTASFDDNDPLGSLSPVWTIESAPAGSTAAFDDATSFTPLFSTDLAGTYILSLTVTDTGGLTSGPDEVLISTDNLAPTAVVDVDPVVVVGSLVTLDGSASTDPEADPRTFDWDLSGPAGSLAAPSDSTAIAPTFVADVIGDYVATLTVSDAIGPGAPASATVTAISAEDYASGLIDDAESFVDSLPASEVTTQGNANALTNFLQQAAAAIQEGDIDKAISKLEQALNRVDGCAERGAPDGNGSWRDWVTTCPSQAPIYDALSAALAAIHP